MSRWTLIPMRGLSTGKSRLAGVLDDSQRRALNLMLLHRVMAAVSGIEGHLGRCIVVSAGDDALDVASSAGAMVIRDSKGSGLNGALEQARCRAHAEGACSVLTLAADLPTVTAHALRQLLVAAKPGDAAIVADKHRRGTNGLLLPADVALPFTFGEHSLRRHRQGLRELGLEPLVWHDAALAFDLDSPADYEAWRATHPADLACVLA